MTSTPVCLRGPYRSPRVRAGSKLTYESRDFDVLTTEYSDIRIPWTTGRRPGISARGLVL